MAAGRSTTSSSWPTCLTPIDKANSAKPPKCSSLKYPLLGVLRTRGPRVPEGRQIWHNQACPGLVPKRRVGAANPFSPQESVERWLVWWFLLISLLTRMTPSLVGPKSFGVQVNEHQNHFIFRKKTNFCFFWVNWVGEKISQKLVMRWKWCQRPILYFLQWHYVPLHSPNLINWSTRIKKRIALSDQRRNVHKMYHSWTHKKRGKGGYQKKKKTGQAQWPPPHLSR